MKNLNEIEPRNIISALPYAISNSGSYYVSANLIGTTNSHGITIDASNVTLDLNGFAIVGSAGLEWWEPALDTTWHGVNIPEIQDNITIRNGAIRHWGRSGIRSILGKSSRIEKVIVANCGSTNGYAGIDVGVTWTIEDCVLIKNSGDGLSAGGATVWRSEARDNGRHGFMIGGGQVENCTAKGNAHNGIEASDNTAVRSCVAEMNGTNGIKAANGCYVVGNYVNGNGTGIHAGNSCRIEGNHLSSNGYGIRTALGGEKSLVIRNSVISNDPARNYDLSDTTHFGEILTPDALGTNFVQVNPWANFSM